MAQDGRGRPEKPEKSLSRKQIAAILAAAEWGETSVTSEPAASEPAAGRAARVGAEAPDAAGSSEGSSADPPEGGEPQSAGTATSEPRRPGRFARGPERVRTGRRLRRRALNSVLIVVVVMSLAAAVVFAAVPHLATAAMHQVSAWLADDQTGSAVQVDGLTGKPDAQVTAGTAGHRLVVVQDGSTVLVEDPVTGQVSRIDPAQLDISATASISTAGTQILVGDGHGYLVDPRAGTVQPINPDTLTILGPRIGAPQLKAPLGDAQVGPDGTLWVADNATGQLVPIHGASGTGPAEQAGRPGDRLLVSITSGTPVVSDTTNATVVVPAGSGPPAVTVSLPAAVAANGSTVLEPPATDGTFLPIAVSPGGQLVLVNTAAPHAAADTVTLGFAGDRIDPPLMLGSRVYVPDETRGTLLVYDTNGSHELAPIAVGSGPGAPLDAFVQDGELWVNAPGSNAALCINAGGDVQRIDKAPGAVPSAVTTPPSPPPPSTPPPSTGAGGPPPPPSSAPAAPPVPVAPPAGPGPSSLPVAPPAGPPTSSAPVQAPPPSSSPPAPPPPAPVTAPPSVTEQANGDGSITVAFTPVTAGSPTYQLVNNYGTGSVSPSGGIPTGASSDQFTVSGLTCGQSYTFGVTAVFPNGSATTTASAGAQSCQAPGSVSGLQHSVSPGQISLNWNGASSNGGSVSYQVSWSGPTSGSKTTSSTSVTITGLTNWNTYNVSVTPSNGAGQGGSATASVDLSGPSGSYQIYRATTIPLQLRSGPNDSDSSVASFPLAPPNGPGATITVTCQTIGGAVNQFGLSGDVWDKTTYNGQSGYAADIYVDTPNSNSNPTGDNSISSPLWPC